MPEYKERIFFFEGSKKRLLLGFLHLPVSVSRETGIVYCHPFADEQNLSHRVAVETSRKIAESGFPVLRFDLSGCGDSEGELHEVSRLDWQEDLRSAINFIKVELKIQRVLLWGLRLGASLALLYAVNNPGIDYLILWQPVTDFKKYFNQFIKREVISRLPENRNAEISIDAPFNELDQKGQVNIIGYVISKYFLDSFLILDKSAFNFQKPVGKCIVFSISLMDQPSFGLKDFSEKLIKNGMDVKLKHIKADSFWDRYWRWSCPEITAETTHWIDTCK